ncbi:hypothetical protein PsorP6_011717 [Peronosclerospora sorghi]|uniref:Uncharacterized protein n=1 Tax=Peronosclerospora sorghi TaxID=230839 RepID=A0ACC0WL64_9STRA|nr:hypothetical protein PsorP6_011717 [Peronosclerospora sorghi]
MMQYKKLLSHLDWNNALRLALEKLRTGFSSSGSTFAPKILYKTCHHISCCHKILIRRRHSTQSPSLPQGKERDERVIPDTGSRRGASGRASAHQLSGFVSASSAALAAAAAIRRRDRALEQTATSLYRRMSVCKNSAPEPTEGKTTSLTGSSGGSTSPQSYPEFRARRGMCVATTFGTGTVVDVRLEDGFYVVQLVPISIAYLREETIIREIKSVVGERVKTR